jgi:hypothetical protein
MSAVEIEYNWGVSKKYRFESFCYGPKSCSSARWASREARLIKAEARSTMKDGWTIFVRRIETGTTDKMASGMDIFGAFRAAADPEKAEQIAVYMKNRFPFLGIPKPERAKLSFDFLKAKGKADCDWGFMSKPSINPLVFPSSLCDNLSMVYCLLLTSTNA